MMMTPPTDQHAYLRRRLIRLGSQLDQAAFQLDLARQRHASIVAEHVRVQAQLDQLDAQEASA